MSNSQQKYGIVLIYALGQLIKCLAYI